MVHAGYLRAQAELCFGIARSLSDPIAAKKTWTLANDYVRRAEEVESCNSEQASKKTNLSITAKEDGRHRLPILNAYTVQKHLRSWRMLSTMRMTAFHRGSKEAHTDGAS